MTAFIETVNMSALTAQILFGLIGLIGLYAALRPEQCLRYFLVEWQRQRLSCNLKAVSLSGWVIFIFCVLAITGMALENILRPHAVMLEAIMFLLFALAWFWWGSSLWFRPDSFLKQAKVHLPVRVIKGFGLVLLLGAAGFAYYFGLRVKTLLR